MELSTILQQIDELKKEAEKLQPAKAEFEKTFWDKFRLEFNYNSNHLEGNTLTYGHTQLLLIFDKVGADYTGREIEEMKAHDLAWKMVRENALDKEHILTEKFIREINELILVRPFYKEAITPDGQATRRLIEPGQYKKYPNSVRLENGEIFNYASPEETPALMGELIEWYRTESENTELHPVELSALFHYRFVKIHPFDDSNGRTSRLMMNYILLKFGYSPVIISSSDKKNYLASLNKADTGDIESFVKYIAEISDRWQEIYLKAIKGENIEEDTDFEKKVELLKRRISGNKKPKIKKSQEAIRNVFSTSLVPLFESIVQKISALDFVAHSREIHFGFDRTTTEISSLEYLKKPSAEIQIQLNEGKTIFFKYVLKGIAAKKNIWDLPSEVLISFKEYTYSIELDLSGTTFLSKKYDEPLTTEDINTIAKEIAERALSRLNDWM